MKTRYHSIINPDNPNWPRVIVFEAEQGQSIDLPAVKIFLGTEYAQRKTEFLHFVLRTQSNGSR